MRAIKSLSQRFWEKVNKAGPVLRPELGPCWVWTGARLPRGYGKIWVGENEGTDYAHRVSLSWKLDRPIGFGLEAAHRCDNPPCVNPGHLFEATPADNTADKVDKKRHSRGPQASGAMKRFYSRPGAREARGAAMRAYYRNTPGAAEKNRDAQGGAPILCLNNGVVYRSQMEAARQLGIGQGGISLVITGARPHYKGFRFATAA